ncbi:MAG: EamA family transporter [Anaerolineales bacterium]|nr:EamA family transporter [Anaerolineales bacterium]
MLQSSHKMTTQSTTRSPSHSVAVAQALLVTFLWSSSWVLIKFGLKDIPALIFAGIRYSLAFICLLCLAMTSRQIGSLRSLTLRQWGKLSLLGIFYYTITQGSQFYGLAFLPAITVSLLLNFTTLIVALFGILWLGEKPSRQQWIGIVLCAVAGVVFFYPAEFPRSQLLAIIVVVAGVFANAIAAVMGRDINRTGDLAPLTVTTVSMGVGSLFLLVFGFAAEPMPSLTPLNWGIIIWLAVINTAIAFTLWNHTLRTLPAVESSIINSTMIVQIALLAWLFLNETITLQKGVGMILAITGAILVQIRPKGL